MVTEAVVLAGGLGTRLRAVLDDVPKPMAPVRGRPFLEYLLEYWIGQGLRRFVLSTGHLAGKISAHFGAVFRGAEIAYAREDQPLGTGGALLSAAACTAGRDILVLNGDTYFAVALAPLAAFHATHGADCTLSLFRSQDVNRYLGIEVDAGGAITSLASRGGGLANGGVYLLRSAALKGLPWQPGARLSLESDLLPQGRRAGWRLCGYASDARFIDIGIPEDYRRAAEVLP